MRRLWQRMFLQGLSTAGSHGVALSGLVSWLQLHLALELVDEEEAEAILDFCEEHLERA